MNSSQSFPDFVGPMGHPLKVVVLECPYDTLLAEPIVQDLFPKILTLKIKGYQGVYPYGVLPIDDGDFIGNHILLVEDTPQGFIPHMGFKSVSFERCAIHRLPFPAFTLLEHSPKDQSPRYLDYLQRTIEVATAENEKVAYNGSWTVSHAYRKMKSPYDFRDITNVMLTRYYQSYNIQHVIAGAVVKFKVNEMKIFMGFDYFKDETGALPPIRLDHFGSEEVAMMHLRAFSPAMIEFSKRDFFQWLWETRVTIRVPQRDSSKKAA